MHGQRPPVVQGSYFHTFALLQAATYLSPCAAFAKRELVNSNDGAYGSYLVEE